MLDNYIEKEEEKVEIKIPCVITAHNPVDDFNKHLENGVDSKTGNFLNYFSSFFILIIYVIFLWLFIQYIF